MSATKILELRLPFDFQPDKILDTATPDQCTIVLTTGCQALHAVVNKTNELTNEQAYEEAQKVEADKWSRETLRLKENAEREKNQLKTTHADHASSWTMK